MFKATCSSVLPLCIYMRTYICAYIHLRIHVHMCICVYKNTYLYTYTPTCICIYIYISNNTNLYFLSFFYRAKVSKKWPPFLLAYKYSYIGVYIYAYLHKYTYKHVITFQLTSTVYRVGKLAYFSIRIFMHIHHCHLAIMVQIF
jgi:hypothetical protein